jgi:hypothetical protein
MLEIEQVIEGLYEDADVVLRHGKLKHTMFDKKSKPGVNILTLTFEFEERGAPPLRRRVR